ncbi:MAG TPA: hypothetical protein VM869_30345 [Enhygromyxa sp.]|nr:hypothetical protein [Enhygromyxa sp.]
MPQPPDSPCGSVIERAIESLSDADWYRLRQVARILAWKVPTMDGEELLFEALERTLDDRRRWNRAAVEFVGHLIGVMRSIASHEASRRGLDTVGLTSSMDLIAPENPESSLSAEEQIRRLRAHFGERSDGEALQVLDAMELGCDGATIRAQLDITQTQLETIVRRIRRAALRVLPH